MESLETEIVAVTGSVLGSIMGLQPTQVASRPAAGRLPARESLVGSVQIRGGWEGAVALARQDYHGAV